MRYRSQEDYLRVIYFLIEKNKDINVKSIDIANILHVSKAAVSKMSKKMQSQGLLLAKPYSTISLSEKGLDFARTITCKHRVIEVFLTNILKVEEKNVYREAHELEHAFSDETIKKLSRFLKNPKLCPHGKIIPSLKSINKKLW